MDTSVTKGYLFAMGAVLIWSGFILVSRLGGISELNHYDVIALRYATCTLILLPVWWFKQRFALFQLKYWLLALVGGIGYAMFTFHGFQLAPASHGALLLPGSMPLFMFVMAIALGQAKFTLQKTLGVSVITLGITALFLEQWGVTHVNELILKGDIYFLIGAIFWCVFSVLINHWGITPWQATISLAILTCIMYLPWYIVFAPKNMSLNVLPDILMQMIYQGFLATIVQLLLLVRAIKIIGAANMGALMALVPLIAGIAALFVFEEPVTFALVVGLIMVAFGSWLTHSRIVETAFIKLRAQN